MTETPLANVVELTVSEVSAALKRTVEDNFSHVRVRGEISGYRGPHSSGHVYFALKDEGARLDAVIWKGVFGKLRVKPEEGLEVIVTGRITTYPGRSNYQIVIETVELAGLGALMALLEKRRQQLAAEGLFDAARKKPLPYLPRVIGVVTSPTGAVIRDILHRLEDRFPCHVLVWPVRVQGETSAAEVAAAISGFNALPQDGAIPRPDVLIVARGGGSLEDLWSFNEEIVVRAAAASTIPLISAVGHETDTTLIDFAADLRAPTPTAAAEKAVPVRSELLSRIATQIRRLFAGFARGQDERRNALRAAARALPSLDTLLAIPRQRFDGASDRLPRALRANAQIHHTRLSRIAARLSPQLLQGRIARGKEMVAAFGARQRRAGEVYFARRRDRLSSYGKLLSAYSYRGVLQRGFALVRDHAGAPVRAASAIAPGMRLAIEFYDGVRGATADDGGPSPLQQTVPEKPAAKPAARPAPASRNTGRGGSGSSGQGNLF